MMLSKVVRDLQYIQTSQCFQQVLDTSATESAMEAIADTAVLFAKKLKLCFGAAVEKLDAMEAQLSDELDEEIEILLGGGLK